MKKLIFKLSLFGAVVFLYIAMLSLMPLNTFTFRNWEALLWGTDLRPTPGKFYPKKITLRDELGDLGHGSRYARVKKNIAWETDEYGFRNKRGVASACSIVLVGDSNALGTGVSQDSTLEAGLSHKIKMPVYSYSPMEIDKNFLDNLATMRIKPSMVIYQTSGVGIPKTRTVFRERSQESKRTIQCLMNDLWNTDFLMGITIAIDRFWKKEPFRYLQSRIDSAYGVLTQPVIVGTGDVLFLRDTPPHPEVKDPEIREIAQGVKKISDSFHRLGIEFIFVPIPKKEAVYLELLPEANRKELLNKGFFVKLKQELDRQGVRSVDIYSDFRSRFLLGERLYFSDDTHWNEAGIDLASEMIAREISRGSQK